jgi:succinoglycan biosynthesis protein ExoV
MKLFYHKVPDGTKNFGDDLNPWLWDQLIPGIFDGDETVTFIGIGTLINHKLPNRTRHAKKRIIFGTGVGYGQSLPEIDETYKIYCLRGPLSAQALGVSSDLAVTDGAALIRKVYQAEHSKKHQFAYMPHFELAGKAWEQVCQELGFGYIDPRGSIAQVLASISQTEILLTEAMHGAIIADALRVPWIPIVSHSSILSFKWQDWCASVGVEYQPKHIQRLHHPREQFDALAPVRWMRDWARRKAAAMALKQLATNIRPSLSSDRRIELVTEILYERLHQFKDDFKAGDFT